MNKTKFTPEVEAEIAKRVEDELVNMVKVDQTRMIMFMLSQMGKMVVETNAETLDLSQDATINNKRYKIKAKITVKKLKPILTSITPPVSDNTQTQNKGG